MAELNAFLPYVRAHVTGLPVPMLEHEIRSAAIRFCERSRAWKAVMTLDVTASEGDYTLPVPEGALLVVLEEAYWNQQPLLPRALDELKQRWEDWLTVRGNPLFYTQLSPDTVRLVPIPMGSLTGGLVMRACFKPSRLVKTLPDWLFDQYAEVIAAGALSVLFNMPDLPCYNPKLAMFHQTQFELGADKAKTRADKSFTRAPRRVVGRFM